MSVPQGRPASEASVGVVSQNSARSASWQRGLRLDWTGRLSAGDSAPSSRDDLVIGVTEFVAVRGEILVHVRNVLFSHLGVPVAVGFGASMRSLRQDRNRARGARRAYG